MCYKYSVNVCKNYERFLFSKKMKTFTFWRGMRKVKNRKGVSIVDVAREANVSAATVSRVVNNIDKVKPEVRQKVLDTIRDMGYSPNHAARALVKKKSNCIGIIVNNLHDPFFHDLIKGFEMSAQQTSYAVMFCSVLGGDVASKEQYVRYLTNGVVDAVILYGSYLSDQSVIRYLKDIRDVDYVMIEDDVPELECNKLLIDNFGGAKKAVEYLVKKGHRRIAHICGSPNKKVTRERMDGYQEAMKNAGLEISEGYIQYTSTDYRSGYACANALLDLQQPPTAVFCSDDAIASFAVRAALDRGLRVPEDISVMGFDNQTILPDHYRGPDITSVNQPLYKIGMDSVKLLSERLNSEEPMKPVRKVYQTEIVEKETVSECKAG